MMLILLVLISILCIVFGNVISDSILHPIKLMMIMWIGFILFSVLYWNTEYVWNYSGLIWIMLSIISTEAGAIVVLKNNKNNIRVKKYDRNYDWKVLKIIIIMGIIAFLIQLGLSGFNLSAFSSIDSIINMNTKVAEQRYYGKQETTIISQILLLFVYLSALCGGYSYNFAKTQRQKLLSTIGAVLPEIGMIFFSNTKAGFIACCILWLAGWCLSYLFLNGKLPKISIKKIFILIVAFIGMISILYFVMLLRTGDFSIRMQKRIINKLWVYALAQVVNFDYWFSIVNLDSLQFGLNNFMFIFKDLGLTVRVQGVYSEILTGYGNIFTAFRGIICDFGKIGGLLYCFIRGILTQYCILKISTGNIKTVFPSCMIIGIYFWNIYGFIISPWIYNSYILAVLGFGLFLLFVHQRIHIGKERISDEKINKYDL